MHHSLYRSIVQIFHSHWKLAAVVLELICEIRGAKHTANSVLKMISAKIIILEIAYATAKLI